MRAPAASRPRAAAAARRAAAAPTRCAAAAPPPPLPSPPQQPQPGRREALVAFTAAAAVAAAPRAARAKQNASRTAGDFCPPAATDGFVLYTPAPRYTPSLRAGVITDPYSFEVPPAWNEGTILNIASGNFCFPRCEEPWTESVWESKADEAKAKLVVVELRRLAPGGGKILADLGAPANVAERVGPYVTGNYLDSADDIVAAGAGKLADGRDAYVFELAAPYAADGDRQLCALAVKGPLVYMWAVTASERGFARSEAKLRHVLASFAA